MKLALRLVLLAGLAGLVLTNADLGMLFSRFDRTLVGAALLIQPVLVLGLVFAALRLRVLVRNRTLSLACAMKVVLLANGLNAVLPARLSEVLKITYIHDHGKVSLTTSLAAVFLERISDAVLLAIMVLAALGIVAFSNAWIFLTIALLGLALVAGLPHLERPLFSLSRRLPWRLSRQASEWFLAELSATLHERRFLKAQVAAMAIWAASCASVILFLSQTLSVPLGFEVGFAVFVAGVAGGAIPALPAGLGTYEAAVVFVLQRHGIPFEEALSIALGLHASQIGLFLAGGLAVAAYEGVGLKAAARRVGELMKTADSS